MKAVFAIFLAAITSALVAASTGGKDHVNIDGKGKFDHKDHKVPLTRKEPKPEAVHKHEEKIEAPRKTLDFDESDADDVALDEVEAMTIASMLLKKNWSPPPAVSCVWNLWGEWGDCAETCGKNVKKERKRTIKTQPAHGGTKCKDACAEKNCKDKEETTCDNTPECEGPTQPPTTPPPQNFATRMAVSSLLPIAGLFAIVMSSTQ